MLDKTKHETVMRQILDDIYSHPKISHLLGFKGGTACYFFYHLPRFSTDLDFNLTHPPAGEPTQINLITTHLPPILKKHGQLTDQHIKKNTIFYLLSHTTHQTAIKIEISTKSIERIHHYDLLEFYGTSIPVMQKPDIFAGKLIALTHRPSPTSQDLFDINYFFQNHWDISTHIIQTVTHQTHLEYLATLPKFIETNFHSKNIHQGLGELVNNETQRQYIRTRLIPDTINQIQFYLDSKNRA